MARHDDTDAVDRLLRRAATGSPEPAGPACVDPERLAAFVDGSLPPAERTILEAHAADCGRCLALLAAMERTHEPAPERAAAWWRLPNITRWAVPLTAATALALWVLVDRDRSAPPTQSVPATQTRVETAPAPAPTPAPASTPAPVGAQPDDRTATAERSAAANAVAPPAIPIEPPLQPQASLPRTLPGTLADAPTPPRATERLEARDQKARVAAPAASPPPPVPELPPPLAETVVVAPAPPPARAPQASIASMRIAPIEIASPDPQVKWRVSGVAVERTTDGGATWAAQSPGIAVQLLAGSAPSATVCWLAGREGTVMLTTDGTTWRRVPFPSATDVTAVHAVSDREATVTTADRRRFRTTDGGQTWVAAGGG